MPAFEKSEFQGRLAKLRALMAKEGIDALLVLSEPNIFYLTGYEGFSDYVPQVALITQDGGEPDLMLREMDVACAVPTCWMDGKRLLAYDETYIGTKERTPWEPIAAHVAKHVKSKRIAVEFSAKGFGVKEHAELLRHLKLDAFLDGDGLVSRLKRHKSAAELRYIEEAGTIVDRAMTEGVAKIAVGVREADVAATILHALTAGTEAVPGGPGRMPTMPVAPMATAPHLKWSDARYKAGSQTNFEIGGFRHRYCCGLSRTAYLGTPGKRLKELHAGVLEGWHAGFAATKPGNTCGHIHDAFWKAFAPHKIRKESRIGYSIGIDWNDGGASIQPNDPTELVPGMTLHLIVGIWEPEDGYVFSETLRIEGKGARSMSKVPREILVRPT